MSQISAPMSMAAAIIPPMSHQLNGGTGGASGITGAGAGAGGGGAGAGGAGAGAGAGGAGAGGCLITTGSVGASLTVKAPDRPSRFTV